MTKSVGKDIAKAGGCGQNVDGLPELGTCQD